VLAGDARRGRFALLAGVLSGKDEFAVLRDSQAVFASVMDDHHLAPRTEQDVAWDTPRAIPDLSVLAIILVLDNILKR